MQSSINKFQKGLVQDISDVNQQNSTYSDSMNGSLMYNDNGNYDWVIKDGNKLSFTLSPDNGTDTATTYRVIGAIGNVDIKVLFSVNDDNPADIRSEIGLFSSDEEGNGTYKTLFNDRTLPNVDRLLFKTTNQIEARFLYENDDTIRVYWVDGVESDSNPPRTFTFKYDGGGKGDANNYSAVTTDIHSINSQADFNQGIIKYVQNIGGNILSGVYQYTYRCITKDGYASPWSIPTRRLFVTSDEVNSVNYNNYEMEGSGIPTTKGNRIEIKGVDTRFKDIEVAFIYCETDLQVTEVRIFAKYLIDNNTTMTFDHVNMSGDIVLQDTIASSYAGITAAKTLQAKDDVLYLGNIIEGSNNLTDAEKDAVVANVTLTPIIKHMRSDELDSNRQQSPITHQIPKTGTLTKSLNSSQSEDYQVVSDYVNYKGTQVEKEFVGYWRGETYRFALQLLDKRGFPLFAIHLGDLTMPEQTTKAYSWKRLRSDGSTIDTGGGTLAEYPWLTDNFGAIAGTDLWNEDNTDPEQDVSKIRILGVQVDGIDLSGVKDRISGYAIVRAERDKTILAQGLGLPCVKDWANPSRTGDELTRPFYTVSQRWFDDGTGQMVNENYQDINDGNKFELRDNIFGFYAPDFDFDQLFVPTVQTGDRLKIVSSSFGKGDNTGVGIGAGFGQNPDRVFFTYGYKNGFGGQHTINKQYYSWNDTPFTHLSPYPAYLDECEIEESIYMLRGEKKIYDGVSQLYLDNNPVFVIDGAAASKEGYFAAGRTEVRGTEKDIIYYKIGDFTNGSKSVIFKQNWLALNDPSTDYGHGGFLINYVRPNANPYGGLTQLSLEQTRFFSTGHYQPVNNTEFTAPPLDVYNSVEVWGGDCYVDYMCFLRTYSGFWGATRIGPLQYGVSHGISMPYESVLNYSLRQAPSANDPMFPTVGALSQDEFDGLSTSNWSKGLYDARNGNRLVEEFEINGALLQKELIKFFSTEPQDFVLRDKYPFRWQYTGQKIYGELIDSWRTYLAFDNRDLNGTYGQVTSSAYYNNQIYSFQEKAFGRLRASDRTLLPSSIGTLTTGTGEKLEGIDYISTKYGNQHQFSLVNSGRSLYWVDVDKRKGMRFAGDGKVSLSDMRGLHSWFKEECSHFYNSDNPANANGICGVFDYENNNLIWTFARDYHIDLNFALIVNSVNPNSTGYYTNNNTIFVNGNGGTITFPEGAYFGDDNEATVYYVANKIGGASFDISTAFSDGVNPPTVNVIATINGGEYYEIKRDNNSSSWTATQVTLADITPHKSTIVYNEDLNSFMSWLSIRPTYYWDHKNQFFSYDKDFPNIENKYYVHNAKVTTANFYGQDYKSYISLNVNELDYATKVFDTIRLNGNEQVYSDYTRFLFETEKQSYYYDTQTDTRLKYLEDSIRMPVRTFEQTDRSRGKWISFTLEFKNNEDISVKLYNLITSFRISNRI